MVLYDFKKQLNALDNNHIPIILKFLSVIVYRMENKKIILLPNHEKNIKDKPKRKVSFLWSQCIIHCDIDDILDGLTKVQNTSLIHIPNGVPYELYKQCSYKRSGYIQQDRRKKMTTENVVSICDIATKLIESNLQCYYCTNTTTIFYKDVRDPKQWTLDRLDNTFGHTKDNVVICCLSCNIGRKTMYKERYLFTKQLNITKQGV